MTKRYRNEWKYICSESQLALLQARLQGLLPLDAHAGADGRYYIHSLYFDDLNDSCAFDNDVGESDRFKYRIRYYGTNTNEIFLERKEKLYGRCHKDQCRLSLSQYHAVCTGDVSAVLWETENVLLKRFCTDILTRGFMPKAIVDYERIAFVEPITNIRVTLDENITVAIPDSNAFLTGEYTRFPLQEKGRHVLEVKFDDVLPGHIKHVLDAKHLQQTSFSKYYLGRLMLKEIVL